VVGTAFASARAHRANRRTHGNDTKRLVEFDGKRRAPIAPRTIEEERASDVVSCFADLAR